MPGGWRAVREANHRLVLRARSLLCKKLELEPPCPETLLGSMATLPLPAVFQGRPKDGRIDAEQLDLYDKFGVEVPFMRIGRPEKRYFRISAHLYNAVSDYEALARALELEGRLMNQPKERRV